MWLWQTLSVLCTDTSLLNWPFLGLSGWLLNINAWVSLVWSFFATRAHTLHIHNRSKILENYSLLKQPSAALRLLGGGEYIPQHLFLLDEISLRSISAQLPKSKADLSSRYLQRWFVWLYTLYSFPSLHYPNSPIPYFPSNPCLWVLSAWGKTQTNLFTDLNSLP